LLQINCYLEMREIAFQSFAVSGSRIGEYGGDFTKMMNRAVMQGEGYRRRKLYGGYEKTPTMNWLPSWTSSGCLSRCRRETRLRCDSEVPTETQGYIEMAAPGAPHRSTVGCECRSCILGAKKQKTNWDTLTRNSWIDTIDSSRGYHCRLPPSIIARRKEHYMYTIPSTPRYRSVPLIRRDSMCVTGRSLWHWESKGWHKRDDIGSPTKSYEFTVNL
jgi:hypothetical protein